MKKLLPLILCLIFCLSAVSCGGSGKALISLRGETLTDGEFTYSLALAKSQYLYSYLAQSSSDGSVTMTDVPELWAAEVGENGMTLGKSLLESVVLSEKTNLLFASMAGENSVSLTSEEEKEIDSTVSSMEESSGGDLDGYLKPYGLSSKGLKEKLMRDNLAAKVKNKLFSSGKYAITTEDIAAYYSENFASVKHIYINNVNYLAESGKTVPMKADEKAKKSALAAEIMTALDGGTPFEELMEKSEDTTFFPTADDLLTIEKGDVSVVGYEVAVFDMAEGEVRKIETPQGIFILKKFALDRDALEDEAENIFATLAAEKTSSLLDEAEKDFDTDETLLSTFSTEKSPIFDN